MGERADREQDDAAPGSAARERSHERVEICDRVIARCWEADELVSREQVAKALIQKGFALGALLRFDEELRSYDQVVARFGHATESVLVEQVACALVNTGARLWRLGEPQDAVAAYDEVLARLGVVTDPTLLEPVARALLGKGSALGTLRRFHDAVLTFDEVLMRFGDAREPVLREIVACALVNESFALQSLKHADDAIEIPEAVLARHAAALAATRTTRQGEARAVDDLCPVCGYRMQEPPWEHGTGSQDICPSCGIQFGYHDARDDLHAQIYSERRERWIAGGMAWSSPAPPPEGWNPRWQLLSLMAQRNDAPRDWPQP